MSLEENCKKIDDEYIHVAVKFKNLMLLKKDSEILHKLGLEEAEVGGFKFCIHGFPYTVSYMPEILINPVVHHVKH